MPLNQTQRQHGFIPYGSDDPDVVGYYSMLSADDIGPAGNVFTGTTTNYNSDGMQIATSQSANGRLRFTSTWTNQFANGGHVSFDITPEILDNATVESQNMLIINIDGTNASHVRKQVDTTWVRGDNGASGSTTGQCTADGLPAKTRIHISWNHAGIDLYVNYYLVQSFPWYLSVMPAFNNNIDICCSSHSFQLTKSRISNMQWSTRPIMLPVHPSALNICFVGDSFVQKGQYPSTNAKITGETGDPYGDGTTDADNTMKTAGMITRCYGELAKRGVYIGKIHNFGRGGSFVDAGSSKPLSERTSAMTDDTAGEYPAPSQRSNPQIIVSVCGTNDVGAGTISDADFDTDYKAEIDKWDVYADKIILVNISQRYAAGPGAKEDTTDTLAKNVVIASLADYNSKVRVVDVYTGTTSNSAYIGSDGLHPAALGHAFIGKEIADAIAKVV